MIVGLLRAAQERLHARAERDRLAVNDLIFFLAPNVADRQWVSCRTFRGSPPDAESLVAHLERALPEFPRLRQRVVRVPFRLSRPIWADDPDFDTRRHVRTTRVRAPGGDRQVAELVEELFSMDFDIAHPPWESVLVDGFQGDRFMVVERFHHGLANGIYTTEFLMKVFDQHPDGTPEPSGEPWRPRRTPTRMELTALGALERATRPGVLTWRRRSSTAPSAAAPPEPAWVADRPLPSSPFDGPAGPERRFAWTDGSLERYRAVGKCLGGTIHDVVLAVVAGGIRRHLLAHGHPVEGMELRASVPVADRATEPREPGNVGNRMIAPLPVGLDDSIARLGRVHEATSEFKRLRRSPRDARFHVIVGNVRGAAREGALAGRHTESLVAFSPLFDGTPLVINARSNVGRLPLMLTADPARVPDVNGLAERMGEALLELEEAAAERTRSAGPAGSSRLAQ